MCSSAKRSITVRQLPLSQKKTPHEGGAETDQETLPQTAPFRGLKKKQRAWEAMSCQFIEAGVFVGMYLLLPVTYVQILHFAISTRQGELPVRREESP
ncbi:MAG TPA: hypothetical protein VLC92_16770 [Rhodocyclaceae bacterium]|nr:hypothetical protein [Rhodocyclaceae bacterium]